MNRVYALILAILAFFAASAPQAATVQLGTQGAAIKQALDAIGAIGGQNAAAISVGLISATDLIQVGSSTKSCVFSSYGSFRWNAGSNTIQQCTSAGWQNLLSGSQSTISAGTSSVAVNGTDTISFTTAGVSAAYFNSAGNFVALHGVSATGTVTATAFNGTSVNTASSFVSNNSCASVAVQVGQSSLGLCRQNTNTLSIMNNSGETARYGLTQTNFLNSTAFGYALNATPSATVDVNGLMRSTNVSTTNAAVSNNLTSANISATNLVALADTSQSCSSTISGSVAYTGVSDTVRYCNGVNWVALNSNTAPISATNGNLLFSNNGIMNGLSGTVVSTSVGGLAMGLVTPTDAISASLQIQGRSGFYSFMNLPYGLDASKTTTLGLMASSLGYNNRDMMFVPAGLTLTNYNNAAGPTLNFNRFGTAAFGGGSNVFIINSTIQYDPVSVTSVRVALATMNGTATSNSAPWIYQMFSGRTNSLTSKETMRLNEYGQVLISSTVLPADVTNTRLAVNGIISATGLNLAGGISATGLISGSAGLAIVGSATITGTMSATDVTVNRTIAAAGAACTVTNSLAWNTVSKTLALCNGATFN